MEQPQRRATDPLNQAKHFFLPDFCNVAAVFSLVLMGEILALLLVLASRIPSMDVFWQRLGLASVFVLWCSLLSAATLCLARKHLAKLNPSWGVAATYAIPILISLGVAEITYWFVLASDPYGLFADPVEHFQFFLRVGLIAAIVCALVLRYLFVQYLRGTNIQAAAQARVQALQARIRPHFLFNSMNTIAALVRMDPDAAEEAVEDLSDLFRASLRDSSTQVRMREEREICEIYLRLEKHRLGDRLSVSWDLYDNIEKAWMPGLSLQPLVENAIYHGVEGLPEGGSVVIGGSVEDGMVEIWVENPRPDPSVYQHRRGNGIAMNNIIQRFQLAYGSRGSVEQLRAHDYYRVTLRFPYNDEADYKLI